MGDLSSQTIMGVTRLQHFERAHEENVVASGALAPDRLTTEPSGMTKIKRFVAAEIMFFGRDADNETLAFDIYGIRCIGVDPERTVPHANPVVYDPVLIGSGTAILAAGVIGYSNGTPGYIIGDDKLADTIAWTVGDYGTYMDTITGKTITAYSPADDTYAASLCLPDLMGLYGLVVNVWPNTAAEANALIAFWT